MKTATITIPIPDGYELADASTGESIDDCSLQMTCRELRKLVCRPKWDWPEELSMYRYIAANEFGAWLAFKIHKPFLDCGNVMIRKTPTWSTGICRFDILFPDTIKDRSSCLYEGGIFVSCSFPEYDNYKNSLRKNPNFKDD